MIFLGKVLNIIIFVSFIGSIFSVLSILAKKVLHIALPRWFGIGGLFLFLFPLTLPTLRLFSPDASPWIDWYKIACIVWATGVVAFSAYFVIRNFLAHQALKTYCVCDNEHIMWVYNGCARMIGLRKKPVLYFGTLKEPACVALTFRPAIILNETTVKQLTNKELSIVLSHELMHIKRGHHIFQSVFCVACIIHWFNPFVWISKNDFAVNCEMDCDQKVLTVMHGQVTGIEYATAMLHLMELSSNLYKHNNSNLEALRFLLAKQRMGFILNSPVPHKKNLICIATLIAFIALTVMYSIYASRSYFYPYPAYNTMPEYATYSNTVSMK